MRRLFRNVIGDIRKIINKIRSVKITKRHVEVVWRIIRIIAFIVVLEAVFVVSIILLGLSGLLDLRTIVSITVTEVGMAVLFYYLFGQGRRSDEEEMANLVDIAEKLSQLRVYTFSFFGAIFYYVENTTLTSIIRLQNASSKWLTVVSLPQ